MSSIPQACCCKCKLEKPLSDFYKGRNRGGVQSYCKACKKAPPRTTPPKRPGPRSNLVGQKYSSWVVIEWRDGTERWLVRCVECGREKLMQGWEWTHHRGNRVCVCNRKYHAWRLPPGDAAFNELYASYRSKAARRGFTFDLSKEQFRFLTTMSCAYCGRLPSQINYTKADRGGTGYTYSGVDRIDSTQGYTWDNCKPCCRRCNTAKNDMPLAEWIAHIKQIYTHMGLGEK